MSGLSFEAGQEQALLIAELKAENKELEFELETLTMAKETVDRFLKERRQEVAKLEAEVAGLGALREQDTYRLHNVSSRNIELTAEVERLRDLVERTCGDGCHCMEENNEECALAALQPPETI